MLNFPTNTKYYRLIRRPKLTLTVILSGAKRSRRIWPTHTINLTKFPTHILPRVLCLESLVLCLLAPAHLPPPPRPFLNFTMYFCYLHFDFYNKKSSLSSPFSLLTSQFSIPFSPLSNRPAPTIRPEPLLLRSSAESAYLKNSRQLPIAKSYGTCYIMSQKEVCKEWNRE